MYTRYSTSLQRRADVLALVCADTTENVLFADVLKEMTHDIYMLSFGSDGVIDGEDADLRQILSYPNLKVVHYCGYEFCADDVFDEFPGIKFEPIY